MKRKYITQKATLAAIVTGLNLIILAVYLTRLMTTKAAYGGALPEVTRITYYIYGCCSAIGLFSASILAVFIGISMFSYLDSMRKLDFYESEPVPRMRRFRDQYIRGLLIYIIPTAATFLLGLLTGGLAGDVSASELGYYLYALLRLIILYASTYSIAVLAVMITGTIPMAVAGTIGLCCAEPGIAVVIEMLRSSGLYLISGQPDIEAVLPQIYYMFNDQYYRADTMSISGYIPYDAKSLILFAVMLLLSVLAYKYRQTEDCGRAITYKWVKSLVKMYFSFLVGAWVGEYVNAVYTSNLIAAIWVIIASVVSGIIMEGLFSLNPAMAFKNIWQVCLSTAAALVLVLGFKNDILGLNLRVPEASNVESVIISSDLINIEAASQYNREDTDTTQEITDKDLISEVTALDRVCAEEAVNSGSGEYGMNDSEFNMYVEYKLKNGRRTVRLIMLNNDDEVQQLDDITQEKAFKEAFFSCYTDTDTMTDEDASTGTISFKTGFSERDTTGVSYFDFCKAYCEDLDEYYHFGIEYSEQPVGVVSYTMAGNGDTAKNTNNFPVYPEYERTISWLKNNDIYSDAYPDIDQIQALESRDAFDDEDDYSTNITDPSKIGQILKNSVISTDYQSLYSYPQWNTYTISLKDKYISQYIDYNINSAVGYVYYGNVERKLR